MRIRITPNKDTFYTFLESKIRKIKLDWTDVENFDLLSSPWEFFSIPYIPHWNKHIKVSEAKSHDFLFVIDKDGVQSIARLYELLWGANSQGIINVKCLGALNIFMGGRKEQSKNVMIELFRNLSLQAESKSNLTAELYFSEMSRMKREIEWMCNRKAFENK